MAPGGQFGEWVGDVAVSNVEVVDWLLKALIVPLSENKYFVYEGWQKLCQKSSSILLCYFEKSNALNFKVWMSSCLPTSPFEILNNSWRCQWCSKMFRNSNVLLTVAVLSSKKYLIPTIIPFQLAMATLWKSRALKNFKNGKKWIQAFLHQITNTYRRLCYFQNFSCHLMLKSIMLIGSNLAVLNFWQYDLNVLIDIDSK